MELTGKTSSGFEYTIKQERLDNYELVEAIAEVDDNPLILPKIIKLLLGEQAETLKNHVRDKDGLVPVTALSKEIEEIFSGQKQVKN